MEEKAWMESAISEFLNNQRFVFGKRWGRVPISHDILRNEYWVYNLCFSGEKKIDGRFCIFFIFTNLPNEEEENTLEWKTVDLLNNISCYSSHYSFKRTLEELSKSLAQNKFTFGLLTKMAERFGNDSTRFLIDNVLVRGDKVEYNMKVYYFQPNGNSCYLYEKEEDIGDKLKRVCSPQKIRVKKVVEKSLFGSATTKVESQPKNKLVDTEEIFKKEETSNQNQINEARLVST